MDEQKIKYLDAITIQALRDYRDFMIQREYAGKTINTRFNIIYFMLKKNGCIVRLPKDELPPIETEDAVPYTEDELNRLFGAMTLDEIERYKFFLGTAARSQEVKFAWWRDIDFQKKEFHIRRKPDVKFFPKNHESRVIPLPTQLVEMLKERQKRVGGLWIFGIDEEKPGNHFLRKLKYIALRAGLNCGQCRTAITKGEGKLRRKVEVSCKDHPVCEHYYLHRFRKTCATRWSNIGVPVRTIQKYLGHKNLETTQLYLGIAESQKIQEDIDSAFA